MLRVIGPFLLSLLLGVTAAWGRTEQDFSELRQAMVKAQIAARGLTDPRVLQAMETVPRHLFVPPSLRAVAYEDTPLPIGQGQTISQPYIVAFMTQALEPGPHMKVLEIGTGSGYQAAVLACLVREIYSVEILPSLALRAERILKDLGYDNIWIRIGDGHKGWEEKAPFDAIIVTCAPEAIPEPLVDQLKEGGRMVIPVGGPHRVQRLVKGVKVGGKLETRVLLPVRFVPMIREAQEEKREP